MRNLKLNPTPLGRLFFLIILFCIVPIFDNALPADSKTINNGRKKGYVTIAIIGSGSVSVTADTEPQKVVERMIAHWKR